MTTNFKSIIVDSSYKIPKISILTPASMPISTTTAGRRIVQGDDSATLHNSVLGKGTIILDAIVSAPNNLQPATASRTYVVEVVPVLPTDAGAVTAVPSILFSVLNTAITYGPAFNIPLDHVSYVRIRNRNAFAAGTAADVTTYQTAYTAYYTTSLGVYNTALAIYKAALATYEKGPITTASRGDYNTAAGIYNTAYDVHFVTNLATYVTALAALTASTGTPIHVPDIIVTYISSND